MGKNPRQPPQHLSPCWDMVQGASPGLNDPGKNIIFLRECLNPAEACLMHPLSYLIGARSPCYSLKGAPHVGVTMDEWVTHVV